MPTKDYGTTLEHIKDFGDANRRELDFGNIDLEFYDAFTSYLAGRANYVSHFKTARREVRFVW